jgi:ApaG protein
VNNDIKTTVETSYVSDRSSPIQSYFLFSYSIHIENNSNDTVQLLSRYWKITDGSGSSEDIYGPGVVGKNPTLSPKETFSYSSFCPLRTPMGSMRGSYRMTDEHGVEFDVEIRPFRFIASQVLN